MVTRPSASIPLILSLTLSLGACSASRPRDAEHSRMTRADAEMMLASFHARHGLVFAGLNDAELATASIGEADIYFEYIPGEGVLRCEALIYKFHDEPKPGVIEGFIEEEKITPAGGGHVRYEPENRGLYLARSYGVPPGDDRFAADMEMLAEASIVWGRDVLDRVASRVFGGK